MGGGGGGRGGGGFDLINQALGFELGRKKHLLSQEELQLASLAFVKSKPRPVVPRLAFSFALLTSSSALGDKLETSASSRPQRSSGVLVKEMGHILTTHRLFHVFSNVFHVRHVRAFF